NSSTHITAAANHRMFDSFGNITAQTNSAIDTIFAFTGREHDEETGLQYNRGRYYDGEAGRWISEDPMVFGARDSNLTRYVGNRPMTWADPSGLIVAGGNP